MNHESCPSHSPFLTRTTCQQPSEPELRPAERTRRCLARDCASLPLVARQRKGTWHCAAMCALQVLLCARSTGTELENLQKLKCIEMARQEPLALCCRALDCHLKARCVSTSTAPESSATARRHFSTSARLFSSTRTRTCKWCHGACARARACFGQASV